MVAVAGLAWLLWGSTSPSAEADHGSNPKGRGHFSVNSGDSAEAPAATKAGARPAKKKAETIVDAKEAAKFRRFFLPPLKFENASLEEAMGRIVEAYREAAVATGQTPLDLQIDLSQAARDRPITGTTPRATAGSVIRFVAALSSNGLGGTLPDFRLTALDRKPDRSGKIEVPPDLRSMLQQPLDGSSASDGGDPFAGSGVPQERASLHDILLAMGFDPTIDCQLTGSSLSYGNFSEADLARLQAMIEVANGGEFGPLQNKSSVRILDMADAAAQIWTDGATLDPEAMQQLMRQTAQIKGTDLMSLPEVTARPGETATIEFIKEVPDGEGGMTWTGHRVITNSVPYGLGNQIEMTYETRETADQIPIVVHQEVILPEHGSGVGVSQGPDGKKVIVLHDVDTIDATGRPLAGRE